MYDPTRHAGDTFKAAASGQKGNYDASGRASVPLKTTNFFWKVNLSRSIDVTAFYVANLVTIPPRSGGLERSGSNRVFTAEGSLRGYDNVSS